MTETDAISGTGSEEGPAVASRAGQPGTMDADVRAELQAKPPAPGGGGLDLAHVHRLLAASPGLEGFLQDLTVKAVEAVPGTDACSLMLRRNGHPLTVASSDPLAQLLDERQYQGEFDEGMGGPCLTSVECRCEQHIRDTGEERRWNAYARFAREHGIGSALAIPMLPNGTCLGAMNLYARRPHAFDDSAEAARRLAQQAVGAVEVAVRIDDQAREADDLRTAMLSRSIIDQAIGIVMAQRHCAAATALESLRRASQNRNVKLRDLCHDLVTRVGGRPPQPGSFAPRHDEPPPGP